MFERAKKVQPKVARELSRHIENGTLPRSLLFSGNEYTFRLTTALETVSALTNESLYKNTSNIFLFLSRDITIDFEAKVNLYLYSLTESSFLRAKDALLRMVLSVLYSSLRSADSSKAMIDKEKEAELLTIFSFVSDSSSAQEKSVQNNFRRAKEIVSEIKSQSAFSIDDVRLFKETSQLYSNNNKGKFFIIEGLSKASNSAKNAFLKLLEEPPENTYFFIIEKDKAELGETLLSRLSPFNFRDIGASLKNEIIASYNDDGRLYDNLSDFFLEKGFEESAEIKKLASECGRYLFSKQTNALSERNSARLCVKKIFGKTGNFLFYTMNVFNIFLSELLFSFRHFLNERSELLMIAPKVMALLDDAKKSVVSYNQNPRNVLFVLIDNIQNLCYNI